MRNTVRDGKLQHQEIRSRVCPLHSTIHTEERQYKPMSACVEKAACVREKQRTLMSVKERFKCNRGRLRRNRLGNQREKPCLGVDLTYMRLKPERFCTYLHPHLWRTCMHACIQSSCVPMCMVLCRFMVRSSGLFNVPPHMQLSNSMLQIQMFTRFSRGIKPNQYKKLHKVSGKHSSPEALMLC